MLTLRGLARQASLDPWAQGHLSALSRSSAPSTITGGQVSDPGVLGSKVYRKLLASQTDERPSCNRSQFRSDLGENWRAAYAHATIGAVPLVSPCAAEHYAVMLDPVPDPAPKPGSPSFRIDKIADLERSVILRAVDIAP